MENLISSINEQHAENVTPQVGNSNDNVTSNSKVLQEFVAPVVTQQELVVQAAPSAVVTEAPEYDDFTKDEDILDLDIYAVPIMPRFMREEKETTTIKELPQPIVIATPRVVAQPSPKPIVQVGDNTMTNKANVHENEKKRKREDDEESDSDDEDVQSEVDENKHIVQVQKSNTEKKPSRVARRPKKKAKRTDKRTKISSVEKASGTQASSTAFVEAKNDYSYVDSEFEEQAPRRFVPFPYLTKHIYTPPHLDDDNYKPVLLSELGGKTWLKQEPLPTHTTVAIKGVVIRKCSTDNAHILFRGSEYIVRASKSIAQGTIIQPVNGVLITRKEMDSLIKLFKDKCTKEDERQPHTDILKHFKVMYSDGWYAGCPRSKTKGPCLKNAAYMCTSYPPEVAKEISSVLNRPPFKSTNLLFYKHRCNPNCTLRLVKLENKRLTLVVVALRNINKDEILSIDYGKDAPFSMLEHLGPTKTIVNKCCCGSRECRGFVYYN